MPEKSRPNGWIAVNDLQPIEDILGRVQQPQFNENKFRVGFKLLIPLSHWSESIECECWLEKSYHP